MENDPLADIFGDAEQPTPDPVVIDPVRNDPLADIFEDDPAQTEQPISDPLADIFEGETALASDPLADIFDDAETLDMEVVDDAPRQAGLGDARFWGGQAAQVAVSETGRIASAAAGAAAGRRIGRRLPTFRGRVLGEAAGGAIGFVSGYIFGGLSGGAAGSVVAQTIEDNDEFSYGRLTTDTIINLIPARALVRSGSRGADRVISAATRQAAIGAGVGGTGAILEGIIDDGEVPAFRDITSRAMMGAALGGALGLSMQAGASFLGSTIRKTSQELEKQALRGAQPLVDFINMATNATDANALTTRQLFNVFTSRTMSELAPIYKVGYDAVRALRRATGEQELGRVAGQDIATRINRVFNRMPAEEAILARNDLAAYMLGHVDVLPPRLNVISKDLSLAREQYMRLSEQMLNNHYNGIRRLPEHLVDSITEQASTGRGYLTRAFKYFSDKHFSPSEKLRNEARTEMINRYIARAKKDYSDRVALRKSKAVTEGVRARPLKPFDEKAVREKAIRNADRTFARWEAVRNDKSTGAQASQIRASILENRKDLGPAVERYLGLINDPVSSLDASLRRMSNLAAWDSADATILRLVRETGIGSDTAAVAGQAVRVPLRLRNGDIEGVFVDPNFNLALQRLYHSGGLAQNAGIEQRLLSDLYNTGIAVWKMVKVPFSIISQSTNLVTNFMQLPQQLINPFKGAKTGFTLSLGQFNAVRTRFGSKQLSMYYEAVKREIVEPGFVTSDIFAGLQRGSVGQKLYNSVFVQVPGKIYNFGDVGMRGVVWMNYLDRQAKHFPNLEAGLGRAEALRRGISNPTAEQIQSFGWQRRMDIAADSTKRTYQQYSHGSPVMKSVSRLGLINQFIAFTAELMRNQYNQGRLIKRMISGEYAADMFNEMGMRRNPNESVAQFVARAQQQTGVSVNQKAITREAYGRIAATIGMFASATYGISKLNEMRGVTEENERLIRDIAIPDYAKDQILIINPKKNGEIEWMDASYILPQAQLSASFIAGLREDNFNDALSAGFRTLGKQVGGELNFFMQALVPVFGNYNPRNGRKLSTREDPFANFVERLQWFASTAEPGFYRELRLTFGEEASRTPDQLFKRMTARRVNSTTLQDGLNDKVLSMLDDLSKSRGDYSYARNNNLLARRGDRAIANFNETFRKAHKHVENLRLSGYSDEEIASMFLQTRFGGVNTFHALQGTFPPIFTDRTNTISGQWDEIMQKDPKERESAIRSIDNRNTREALMSRLDRLRRDERLGIGSVESIVRNMGIQDGGRADMIWSMMQQSNNPEQVLKRFEGQGIATQEVVRQIRLKQRAQ